MNSIVNEILYLAKRYRDTYRQAPTTIIMNNDNYRRLCDERNEDNLNVIFGMNIVIDKDQNLTIQY